MMCQLYHHKPRLTVGRTTYLQWFVYHVLQPVPLTSLASPACKGVMSHPEFNRVAAMAWECAPAHSHAIAATNTLVVRCSFGPLRGPKLHRTTAEMPCTMRSDRTYTAS